MNIGDWMHDALGDFQIAEIKDYHYIDTFNEEHLKDDCTISGFKCLDFGFVRLVDTMGTDSAIVQAARTSYGGGEKSPDEDRKLLRYLMRHRHTTPFEMCEFKFHCKMPIFVARQFIRHRTASVNEASLRYTEAKDEFFVPESFRKQGSANKQGGDETCEAFAHADVAVAQSHAYVTYTRLLQAGVSRELARCVLPVSAYTEWYWKIDLHNLLHFLALRCDSHAQAEIRVFADAMLKLIQPIVPLTVEAWNDYHPMRGGMLLSRMEIESIATGNGFVGSQRESDEFDSKIKRLGL